MTNTYCSWFVTEVVVAAAGSTLVVALELVAGCPHFGPSFLQPHHLQPGRQHCAEGEIYWSAAAVLLNAGSALLLPPVNFEQLGTIV